MMSPPASNASEAGASSARIDRTAGGGVGTSFTERFHSLSGFTPMRWQTRLFERFVADDLPDCCDIPTGLGKTSVILIWLLAVVQEAEAGSLRLPRRLFYVVDRRTVVDQATAVVEQLRRCLIEPGAAEWAEHASALREIALALGKISAMPQPPLPLAVSTLRGELADNEEWKADPTRLAIVVGTIDMIGSKLLFSGYGDGRYGRTHHAGLVGQDALIVHDEAHLTPAFGDLLRTVAQEQIREVERGAVCAAWRRRVRILELSATSRGEQRSTFALDAADENEPVASSRLAATKRLHCRAPAGGASLDKTIADAAWAYADHQVKVLVYVRSPETAAKVAHDLRQRMGREGESRVAVLAGTIRGYERDALVRVDSVYRCFCDAGSPVDDTIYLVSTSAGEVGVDLDADHMVCDATTLDSLIQRLGRVNRRGGYQRAAGVDLIADATPKHPGSRVADAVDATMTLLTRWESTAHDGIDVSPAGLQRRLAATPTKDREAAFAPRPVSHPPSDILLDAWSLSSIDHMPGRPAVAAFLHGLTNDPPQVHIAWRREISHLAAAEVDESLLTEWFAACKLETRELLRDSAARVKKTLSTLLKAHQKNDAEFDARVVVLDERGDARWADLSQLDDEAAIANRTLVLPAEVAGLDEHGMLSATASALAPRPCIDLADRFGAERRRERWLHRQPAEGEDVYETLGPEPLTADRTELVEAYRVRLCGGVESEFAASKGSESRDLILLVSADQPQTAGFEASTEDVALAAHLQETEERAAVTAAALGLDCAISTALVAAAHLHDLGKARRLWQRYARNVDSSVPLAKARRYLHPRALAGYRHEFGSLLDATACDELPPDCDRDLVLHLVAAHHGWARPLFPLRSFDSASATSLNEEAAWQVMRRFATLQHGYGRWALAWLESLVRCADIAASRHSGQHGGTSEPGGAGA